MNHLIFKEVDFKDLVKGQKYIIKHDNISYYIGKFSGYSFCLIRLIGVIKFCDIIDIHMQGTHVGNLTFSNEKSNSYYIIDIQKEKIQNAMELRATNIILRRITNDESFTY